MERNIIEFTDRLSAAETRDAAWTTTVDFFNARGFEHGGFARVSERTPVLDDFVTTLPLDYWRAWCRMRNDLTDPGICHARQSTQPVFHHFGKVAADARPPPGVCDLRDYLPGYTATALFATPEPRSAEDEAEGRIGVMAWGAAMDRDAFGAAQRRDGAVLVLAAHLAMAKMARMAGGVAIDAAGKTVFHDARPPRAGNVPNGARLSPRESECLLWLARGLRNDRIAERLGVSPATVEMHLARARRRLAARTREQAVAIAVLSRMIEP